MKVGDLVMVKLYDPDASGVQMRVAKHQREKCGHGVILRFSRTGHSTKSAEVLFSAGDSNWIDCRLLEVISKARGLNEDR